jgi:transcriptional regulator GlxA family with amidase domain
VNLKAMLFALFIYPGVEPIDLAPLGVLSMARRLDASIQFTTIARCAGEVTLSNGLQVIAQHSVLNAPAVDVLIIAGGPGWSAEAGERDTIEFLKSRAATTLLVSICTGAMILARTGLLDGRRATTKQQVVPPEASPLDLLRRQHPEIEVVSASLVDQGTLVTAGGVSLCIDATLHLLQRFYGETLASETARILEYHRAWRANRDLFPPLNNEASLH